MNLHAPRTHAHPNRQQLEFISLCYFTRNQGAGNHRSKAFHREDTIDWQPGNRVRRTHRSLTGDLANRRAKFFETFSCSRTNKKNRRSFEKGTGDQLFCLVAYESEQFLLNQIRFSDYHETPAHIEQPADIEVLACLRHHALIGRYYKCDGVNSMHSRQHILNEALVTWHINKANSNIAQIQIGETQIDSDAPALFFR